MNNLAMCTECGAEKGCDEFYVSTLRADQRAGQCKDCVRARVRARRIENLERARHYDRERAILPHRIANATRVTRKWRQKYPDRLKAHNAAARAGLIAPESCEGCGRRSPLDKHHPDYSKTLLVVWLCKPCHVIADKIRRRLEAS